MIIKLLLIGSVVAVGLFLVRGGASGHHLAIRRIGALAFAICWATAVLAPRLVSDVANIVGVGRGTDLVLYVLVVAFLFATVGQQQQLRALEDRITRLTRDVALRDAHHSGHAMMSTDPAQDEAEHRQA